MEPETPTAAFARRPGEIVDPTGTGQQRRRRTFLRVGLPLLVVGTVIVSILLIALHSYQVNRTGALKLSRQLLQAIQATVAEEVASYLEPAIRSAVLINDMLSHTEAADRPVAFNGYASSMLRQVDQVEAFYLANSAGNFFGIRRAPNGGTEARSIRNDPSGRVVTALRLDNQGHQTGAEPKTDDAYDPRRSEWYTGAIAANGKLSWSSPTLFRPTGKPVITVSIARRDPDGSAHVAAVDVALDDLSRFVAGLKVGVSGHAVIVDAAGRLVAAPQLDHLGADPAATSVERTQDPVLTQAWDRYRVEGFGARQVRAGGVANVTIAAPLPGAAPGWVLLLAAPESDFAGFAVIGGRQNLLFSLVIVLLAGVLAALALRQGRRADRTGRLLAETRERNRDENVALADLVATPRLFDPAGDVPVLTEAIAILAEARRAGIWRLSADGRSLHCEDRFDRLENGHVGGFSLANAELPRFIQALRSGEPLDLADAAVDPSGAEFHRLAMREIGARALVMVPIGTSEAAAGAIVVEDAAAIGRARNLIRTVAAIAALRFRAASEDAAPAGAEDHAAPVAEDQAAYTSLAALRPEPAQVDSVADGLDIYPAAALMVLTFSDPLVATRHAAVSAIGVADAIARGVQDIGAEFELPYLKILNHTLVAAAGCTAEPGLDAAIRLADAAIAIRDLCLESMERAGLDAYFQIGIDLGRAVGRPLGHNPVVFNLWGEAVRGAELMAASAPDPGTIQATEAVYTALRAHFLFRQRGRFFTPRGGVARSFVLAGRR